MEFKTQNEDKSHGDTLEQAHQDGDVGRQSTHSHCEYETIRLSGDHASFNINAAFQDDYDNPISSHYYEPYIEGNVDGQESSSINSPYQNYAGNRMSTNTYIEPHVVGNVDGLQNEELKRMSGQSYLESSRIYDLADNDPQISHPDNKAIIR